MSKQNSQKTSDAAVLMPRARVRSAFTLGSLVWLPGLRRLGYPAAAWAAMAVLGSATVGASLFAGLLGPVAIAVYAVVLSLPVWLVCRLVGRRR